MPYVVAKKIDETDIAPGDGPALIVIHETGASKGIALKTDTGGRWWQPGSEFDRWLCARIRRPTGAGLDSDEVLRFVWSGGNSEAARNRAAAALLALIRQLEEDGRPISIVAHGHGGDVARRACEMAAIAGSSAPPWSVVCVGTPFFHYGLAPGVRSIAIRVVIILFWCVCLMLVPEWLAAHVVKADSGWYALLIVLLGLNALRWVPFALRKLNLPRYRARSRFADRGMFTNLCSRHDEAAALLRSLNTSVDPMRQNWETPRLPDSELGTLVMTALACGFSFLFVQYALLTAIYLVKAVAGSASFTTFVSIAAAFLLLVAVMLAVILFSLLADFPIDLALTRRLRALAYGNHHGAAAITSVELFPWQHQEASAVPLPPRIEKIVEAHIAAHTDSPDASRRISGGPATFFFHQNIRTLVNRALSIEGFAHNAYFRIEPVADLVAESLVKAASGSGRESAPRDRRSHRPVDPNKTEIDARNRQHCQLRALKILPGTGRGTAAEGSGGGVGTLGRSAPPSCLRQAKALALPVPGRI